MRLKRYLWLWLLLIAISISVLPAYSQQIIQHHQEFQVSTLEALNNGVYEGAANFGELKVQGFGLGTFEGLDGELVVLDGKFYQIKTDGVAYPVKDEMQTPFAAVTFFRRERSLRLSSRTYQALQQEIDQRRRKTSPMQFGYKGSFPT
jgi:acetolactate decarboxylase